MKFVSVAVLVALLAAVISAAPSSQESSLEIPTELPFQPQFSLSPIKAVNKIKLWWHKLRCITNVVAHTIKENNLSGLWLDTLGELEQVITKDWNNCANIADSVEKEQCQWVCVDNGVQVVNQFYHKVFDKSELDIVHQLHLQIDDQCLPPSPPSNTNLFSFQRTVYDSEATKRALVDQFQCVIDTVERVSNDTGLSSLWAQSKPQIQGQVDIWQKCGDLRTRLLSFLCSAKQGLHAYKHLQEYLIVVAQQKPQVLRRFTAEINKNCSN